MKLTDLQRELLGHVVDNGQECWDDGAYCETGMYKPFNVRTIRSLLDRGLVYEVQKPDYREPDFPWVLKPTAEGVKIWRKVNKLKVPKLVKNWRNARREKMIEDWDAFTLAFGTGTDGTEERVAKYVFKSTECGCAFRKLPDGVSFCGYAEGADAECPEHRLTYPFKMDDFWRELGEADAEGVAMWHEWNDPPLTRGEAAEARYPGMNYDHALPDSWLQYARTCGHEVVGHFVWLYDGDSLGGRPAPITPEGDVILSRLACFR